MNIFKKFEDTQIKNNDKISTNFKSGDKVCINFKVLNDKIRKKSYNFEGIIISIKNKGYRSTWTVRKISLGEGVEKTFFINSPNINNITLIKKGSFKSSKLYRLKK